MEIVDQCDSSFGRLMINDMHTLYEKSVRFKYHLVCFFLNTKKCDEDYMLIFL